MNGGIKAWNGYLASGESDAGMDLLEDVKTIEDFIFLGIKLEDGTRIFYSEAKNLLNDDSSSKIFDILIKAEEKHKKILSDLYKTIIGGEVDLENASRADIMESGITLGDALTWLRENGRGGEEVLEFSMQIEINSLDLYLKMQREINDKGAKNLLGSLITEEKQHLENLGRLLGNRAGNY